MTGETSASAKLSKSEQIALGVISQTNDPDKLRRLRSNARELKSKVVEEAALRRLVDILPEEAPGTVEHDFWRTIHIFEELLTEERGRTTRLSRTRQKLTRVGVMKVLEDFAMSKQATDGFNMLMERDLPELTGEAVVLRHRNRFASEVIAAARDRLSGAGIDPDALPQR